MLKALRTCLGAHAPLTLPDPDVISCHDGWFNILFEALEDMEEAARLSLHMSPRRRAVIQDDCRVVQIKEKFGTLRIYTSGVMDVFTPIIERAEERSSQECEFCGAVGKLRDGPWTKCRCDACETLWERGESRGNRRRG